METKKIKVAVLGGGAGAMAAAFALSATPERRARYEVTVHQLGFRLGGKAASGRNAGASQRVEANGAHVLLGCYENTFRLVRACYDELARPPGAPLATWRDAFQKQSYGVVFCKLSGDSAHDGGWFPWTFELPVNDAVPGEAAELPSAWALFRIGVEWLWSSWGRSADVRTLLAEVPRAGAIDVDADMPAWIRDALARIEASGPFAALAHPLVGGAIPADCAPHTGARGLGRLVSAIRNAARSLPEDPAQHDAWSHHLLTWLIRRLTAAAWELLAPLVPTEPWAYKLWVAIDLAGAMAAGFLSDGVLFHGFDAIDHQDFRQWLRAHGAGDETLASGPIHAVYDAALAFVNGDTTRGNLAAGTCLRGIFRTLLGYRGAVFWHPVAGLGDTVFAPLFEVLRARGVKFQFFHRVAGLSLAPDRKSVSAIEILQQVKLKEGYDPLVRVKGLPCWPNAPLFDQIVDGDELALSGIDLESPYSPAWKDQRRTTLIAGLDFDQVVLGISLGAIPYIAPELVMADRAFGSMVTNIGTVQSLAFQLWLNKDLAELGWETPAGITERPVTTAYVEPTGAWADVTHLGAHEDWPEGEAPKTIAFFSGPLEQLGPASPFTDLGYLAKQKARVHSIARKYLENDVGRLWPLATKSAGHGFRWDTVISQSHRAVVDPSDRYVLSVAGSTRYRLRAGKSGFTNLVLAGDWVRTSLNLGCVEAAVEGGLYAAEAILGEKLVIFGREV
jgi:uncharacterized protein with NAD-binding domain and iron-sulfur cluster